MSTKQTRSNQVPLKDEKKVPPNKIEKNNDQPIDSTSKLLHRPDNYQIELELQNEELRRKDASQARYYDLYDNAPVGYLTLIDQDLILEANNTAGSLIGMPRRELFKRPITQFIYKEDQDIYYLFRKQLFKPDEPRICEIRMIKHDGTPFWVHMTTTAVAKTDDIFVVENFKGWPAFRVVINNISALKQSEEKKKNLEKKLFQLQKDEAVGRLAGSVANDFNNMFGIIVGHAEMALEHVDKTNPIHTHLMEIRKATMRSFELTKQLLTFAKKQSITPKVINIHKTIEGLLPMLQRLISKNIQLSWLHGAGAWPILMDPSQIEQILVNLVINANDAIVGTGKITIETGISHFDENYCSNYPDLSPGEYMRIGVGDDGCGMNKEILEHIFEPYYTTKSDGKGIGLGLATVYSAVKQNKGFIDVYSEPGHGSMFLLYFPRFAEQSPTIKKNNLKEKVSAEQQTILVVEDEIAILDMTSKILEKMGYSVISANTPTQAINLARQHADKISLLLTDIIMPDMNGIDLVGYIKSFLPNLKYLFMSGYTANIIDYKNGLDIEKNFIQKPFSLKNLIAKVRKSLEK